MSDITVPISPGELIDKITILRIKSERIRDDAKLKNVRLELDALQRTWAASSYARVDVAADESEVFAGYLPYRTWDPRPVVGSAGLWPASWDASHELWGAVQLQNRFQRLFKRGMTARDNQAWVAMRMIGDAVAQTRSGDARAVREHMLTPDFVVADFKGQKLTVRPWNLQLRQPILLTDGRGTVSVSPQEGFLHQTSELDTLGFDQPESKCKLH